jgi:hypothetical protein
MYFAAGRALCSCKHFYFCTDRAVPHVSPLGRYYVSYLLYYAGRSYVCSWP